MPMMELFFAGVYLCIINGIDSCLACKDFEGDRLLGDITAADDIFMSVADVRKSIEICVLFIHEAKL